MNPRHRRFLILTVALFLGLPGLVLLVEHIHGRWRLSQWLKRQREQGEKLAIVDCFPPKPPAVENRLGDLILLCRVRSQTSPSRIAPPALVMTGPGQALVLRTVDHWPANTTLVNGSASGRATNLNWERLGQELSAHRPRLAKAKALLHEPRLDPDLDYHQGFNMLLPHLSDFSWLGRDLTASALFELHEGRLAGAVDDIQHVLTAAQRLENERTIAAQFVRQGMTILAAGATWQALQADGWTDDQLLALQQAWARTEFLLPMSRAVEMERAVVLDAYDRMRDSVDMGARFLIDLSGRPSPSAPPTQSFGDVLDYLHDNAGEIGFRAVFVPTWQAAWSRDDEYTFLVWIQSRLDALRTAARVGYGPNERAAEHAAEQPARAEGLNRFRHAFAARVSGGINDVITRPLNAEGLKELVVTAVALQRYRLRHGHFPAELAPLVPDFLDKLPLDYWSGAPLHYRLRPDGSPLLYGNGSNGRDDGGDGTQEPGSFKLLGWPGGRDVVWPIPVSAGPDGGLPNEKR